MKMSIYLDTSVLIPILVEEQVSGAVNAFLVATEHELLVSELAAAEVASALSRLVRMRLIATADALARLADFEAWRAAASSPADVHPADARLAYAYVRRFELMLRAPDALHLAIATRLEASLSTLDRRLERAAQQLGIEVEVPRQTS
jgi:predicted nucleic acid-binding protein